LFVAVGIGLIPTASKLSTQSPNTDQSKHHLGTISNLDQERIDVCKQELNVVVTYLHLLIIKTCKLHYHYINNIMLFYVYNNFNQTARLTSSKCMFIVNYVLLYVLMKSRCKLHEDGNAKKTCRG